MAAKQGPSVSRFGFGVFLVLMLHSVQATELHEPSAIKVVNLGRLSITAFMLEGFPFTGVGLDRPSGASLTPFFQSNSRTYEFYWRLSDDSLHGAILDLGDRLPKQIDGGIVVISIHDKHAEVTWAQVDSDWHRYQETGDPKKFAAPKVPYFTACEGPLLEHPLATAAWAIAMQKQRNGNLNANLDRYRCDLELYIPKLQRARESLSDLDAARLQAQFSSEIEDYKQERSSN